MSPSMSVFDILPAHLMRASAREEVLARLAGAPYPAPSRRRWWREWCCATQSSVRREELDRVAPARRVRDTQGDLFAALEAGAGADRPEE